MGQGLRIGQQYCRPTLFSTTEIRKKAYKEISASTIAKFISTQIKANEVYSMCLRDVEISLMSTMFCMNKYLIYRYMYLITPRSDIEFTDCNRRAITRRDLCLPPPPPLHPHPVLSSVLLRIVLYQYCLQKHTQNDKIISLKLASYQYNYFLIL